MDLHKSKHVHTPVYWDAQWVQAYWAAIAEIMCHTHSIDLLQHRDQRTGYIPTAHSATCTKNWYPPTTCVYLTTRTSLCDCQLIHTFIHLTYSSPSLEASRHTDGHRVRGGIYHHPLWSLTGLLSLVSSTHRKSLWKPSVHILYMCVYMYVYAQCTHAYFTCVNVSVYMHQLVLPFS